MGDRECKGRSRVIARVKVFRKRDHPERTAIGFIF